MVIVGGPDGVGVDGVVTGGVGEGDVVVAPPEQAANDVNAMRRIRSGILFDAGGATGQVEPITASVILWRSPASAAGP